MKIIGTITESEIKEKHPKETDATYLKEIKDVEEKIGISIVDFFKLTQTKKIYLPRFKAYYEINAIDVKTWEIIVSNKKKIPMQHTLKIKNYGRTWTFKKGGDNE